MRSRVGFVSPVLEAAVAGAAVVVVPVVVVVVVAILVCRMGFTVCCSDGMVVLGEYVVRISVGTGTFLISSVSDSSSSEDGGVSSELLTSGLGSPRYGSW